MGKQRSRFKIEDNNCIPKQEETIKYQLEQKCYILLFSLIVLVFLRYFTINPFLHKLESDLVAPYY